MAQTKMDRNRTENGPSGRASVIGTGKGITSRSQSKRIVLLRTVLSMPTLLFSMSESLLSM